MQDSDESPPTGPVPTTGFWTGRFRPHEPDHSSAKTFAVVVAAGLVATIAFAVVVPAVWSDRTEADRPSELALLLDAEGRPLAIEARGLDPATLAGLERRSLDAAVWSSLLSVASDSGPLPGDREVIAGTVRFHPDRPLEKGRTYRVAWNGGEATELTPQRGGRASTTGVAAIHPASDLVPRNLSSLVLDFSAPMGEGDPLDFLTLVGENGRALPLAEWGLQASWNEERTRLELPLAVTTEGEPRLLEGRKVRVRVSRSWTDAEGRFLQPTEERVLLARGIDRSSPAWSEFRIAGPVSERSPVTLDFPESLDHRSAEGAFAIVEIEGARDVPGSARLSNADTRWTFVPERPWKPGKRYALKVRGVLTDLAGNPVETEGAGTGVIPFRLEAADS